MRTSKKILGVVLALMMLLNVVALGAYAMADSTVCEMTITADKASYAAGDEIVLSFWAQTSADVSGIEIAGQHIISYDATAIEPYTTSTTITDHVIGGDYAGIVDDSVSQFADNDTLLGMGTTSTSGNALAGYFIGVTADTFVNAVAAPVELFTVKMKVKADAPDGDYTIAFNYDSYADYNAYIVDADQGGIYGEDPTVYSATCTNVWNFVPVTIHVGASGPKVAFSKASAKLAVKDGALDTTEGVKNVQMMVKSVITDADFDTYFFNTKTVGNADTAENKNKIKDVGIVAFKGAAANFDEETAKGVVAGTAADNYEAARTDYISKASDSADAYFGAIIKGTWEGTFKNNDIVFLGFVEYYDAAGDVQVIFYETSVTKTITQSWVDANISNF